MTGASSGIGEAAAHALAARGARVALVARSAEKLARVADEIAAAGGKALIFPADLADPDQAERACAGAMDEAGAPDILVNNAGAGRWLSTLETSPAEARAMTELPYSPPSR